MKSCGLIQMMAVILKIFAHIEFELAEQDRQIAKARLFGLGLTLDQAGGHGRSRRSTAAFCLGCQWRTAALLHNMRQFVGQEPLSGASARRVLAGIEDASG